MSKKKITFNNVLSFIEGNYNYYKEKFSPSPQYLQEQYHYRLEQCKNDCVPAGECVYCTCPPLKKAWVQTSCNNGERFPNLMDKPTWEEFKKNNNIDITTILQQHGIQ